MPWPRNCWCPAGSLYRLPNVVDDRAGALVEPGGNAWRAVAAAHAGPGKRLLIWGPGSIGLLATAFARAAGAEVDVAGLDSRRDDLARSFGATRCFTGVDPPPGSYNAVIDCTGDEAVPARAVRCAEPGGRIVYIGLSRLPSLVDSREIALNDITATGILGASAGLAPAIEHYADGRVVPGALAQVLVGLDRAAEALAGQLDPGAGTKIHIDPRLYAPSSRTEAWFHRPARDPLAGPRAGTRSLSRQRRAASPAVRRRWC